MHERRADERADPGAGEAGVGGVIVGNPAVRKPGGGGGEHTGRRRRGAVAGVLVLTSILSAACGGGGGASTPEVAVLGAERIDLGGAPWGVAVDGDTVWVSDASRATLVALDSTTGVVRREVATAAPDPRDTGIAIGDGRLWVANLGGTVGAVDAVTGTPLGRVAVGPGEPAAVAVAGEWVWAPRHGPGGGLTRIDANVDADATTISVPLPDSGFALAVAGGTVWVSGLEQGLFAVDDATGERRLDVELAGAPRGVAVAGGDVWVTLRDRQQVVRVDADTGAVVARIELDGQPWPVAAGAGSVWVATLDGQLLRIDPDTNRIIATAAVAAEPRGVAVSREAVWVTSQTGIVTRVPVR